MAKRYSMIHSYRPLDVAEEKWSTAFKDTRTVLGMLTMQRDEELPLYYEIQGWPAGRPSFIPLRGVVKWCSKTGKWETEALGDDWVASDGCCGNG